MTTVPRLVTMFGTLPTLMTVCLSSIVFAAPVAPTTGANAPSQTMTLDFKDFFEATPRELKPTSRLMAINGKRVHFVGFMAKLDTPIQGAFYLCPLPTFGDEEGGGTADLPPQAVRVCMNSYRGRPMPYVPGPISVTGVFHIGPVSVENGQVSMLQLTLDHPKAISAAAQRSPAILRKQIVKQDLGHR